MTTHPAVRIAAAIAVGMISAGFVAMLSYAAHTAHVWPSVLVGSGVSALCSLYATRPVVRREPDPGQRYERVAR